jgi:hypothetical protein
VTEEPVPPTPIRVGSTEYPEDLLDDTLKQLAAAHPGQSQIMLEITETFRGRRVRWVTYPQGLYVDPTPEFNAHLEALLGELRKE